MMAQDMPTETVNFPCYWMYCDDDGSWRWTYFARKGEKIAVSCAAYASANDCQRGIDIMKGSSAASVTMAEQME